MTKPLYQGARMFLFVNGAKIGHLENLSLQSDSGKIDLNDLDDGFAGWSVGVGKVTVTGTCNIPKAGLKTDFDFVSASSQYAGDYEVEVVVGAESYLGRGVFKNAGAQMSTSDGAKQDFTFEGQSNEIQ